LKKWTNQAVRDIVSWIFFAGQVALLKILNEAFLY